jgi:hypothetical protein
MPIHMMDLGKHINVSKTYKDLEDSLNFHNYFDKIIMLIRHLRFWIDFPIQEFNQLKSNELKIGKPILQELNFTLNKKIL